MDIGEYFTVLQYIMMTTTFIALALIFLQLFYAKGEKEES